jgi:hypothetical protein
VQISDTVTRGLVTPAYPVIEYPHGRDSGGDAIANGFIHRAFSSFISVSVAAPP